MAIWFTYSHVFRLINITADMCHKNGESVKNNHEFSVPHLIHVFFLQRCLSNKNWYVNYTKESRKMIILNLIALFYKTFQKYINILIILKIIFIIFPLKMYILNWISYPICHIFLWEILAYKIFLYLLLCSGLVLSFEEGTRNKSIVSHSVTNRYWFQMLFGAWSKALILILSTIFISNIIFYPYWLHLTQESSKRHQHVSSLSNSILKIFSFFRCLT